MKQPFQLPEKMARFRGQFEQSARDFLIGTVIKGHKHKKTAVYRRQLFYLTCNSRSVQGK
ncbi:hypothetical protein CHCC20441_1817 [Bacillus licheniformis]|nr:hypothetical protein MUY_003994 [Bacillus licheniformis WX-02]ARC60680.1 hypothetical protein BaDB11_02040 [Bacillus licheniformis]PZW80791.1 hypothetical protein DEU48_106201 [Bacillus sp. AG442]TWJ42145.1 hypothetical protein CHCC5026_3509 [Bacillus licheniformis]TWJ48658.1 hypothetical protein CHCC5025_1458 [Bacillus licheniformis]